MPITKKMEEVEAAMGALEQEPGHVRHVRKIAGLLFDQLQDLHGLGPTERFWLEAASLLHDVGHARADAGRRHHKWSARMIREYPWSLLDARDVAVISLTARYHRKSLPRLKHEPFAVLSAADRLIVEKLAALLRVADALDRSHAQTVLDPVARKQDGRVEIHVHVSGDISFEQKAVLNKSDLFQKMFGMEVVVLVSPAK